MSYTNAINMDEMTADFKIQNTNEFTLDFKLSIKKAQTRILIKTMNFEPGKAINSIIEDLITSSEKGVDVKISLDAIYDKFYRGDLILLPSLKGASQEGKIFRHQVTERLRKGGIKVSIHKAFSFFPLLRRNHIKLYVVDNAVWVGGINFTDQGFRNKDLMIKFTNPAITHRLISLFHKINTNQIFQNKRFLSNIKILIDEGRIGKSVIYDTAVDLIKKSQDRIVLSSPFLPSGKLLRTLMEAGKRGIKIRIMTSTNSTNIVSFVNNINSLLSFGQIKKNNNTEINYYRAIHTKALVVDGKQALFGSHNFSFVGVLLGTTELGIYSDNKLLAQELEKYMTAL